MGSLIEILHSVSNKLIDIDGESQIYQIMNEGIKQILPDSYFIITKLQPDDMNFRIIKSFGFDKYFAAIKTLLGKDPFQMDFPFSDLSEKKQTDFETRKLYQAPGGIYEIANGRVNKTFCKAVEKILGISKIYAISFCVGKKYFGGSVIFVPEVNLESGELSKESILTIENLAAQASFAINRLRDFEALTKNKNELAIANTALESQNEEMEKRTSELRAAKEKIEESEAKFKVYTEQSSIAIYTTNIDGDCIYANETWLEMAGMNMGEALGKGWINALHPDDVEHVNSNWYKSIKSNGIWCFEYRFINKKGKITWVEGTAKKLFNKKNELVGYLGTNVNITDRREAELALQRSEIKYKDLVETADIAIIIDDEDGYFKYFNNKFCKIFGFTEKEINQLSIRSLVHPDDLEFVMSFHRDRINGKEVKAKYEFRAVRKDGNTIHLMTSVVPIKTDGKIVGSRSYVWDITERKLMQNEILENQLRCEKAQALGHVGNWEYDLETKLFWVSNEIKRIHGADLNSNNFTMEQVKSYIPDSERVHQAIIDLISHDKKLDIEYDIIHADNKIRKVIHSIAELEKDASNNPIRIRGVILDITEREKVEKSLKESEAKLKESNATKDKFFSIIAHDLRSPFSGILGFSELLIEEIDNIEAKDIEMYLRVINSSAKDTLVLLDNLLKWAESQSGKINFEPKIQTSSTIIKEIIELSNPSAKNKNIVINQIQPEEITVFVDQNMFKTILRNLISNAIKFTNTNGEIDVTALQKDDSIEVTVSDNGVGMNEDARDKLFRLETSETTIGTASEKGSGLGLVLCKEFVQKHGGKIWVESIEGEGSDFKFTMPLNGL